jgi:hypothetical protein
VTVDQQPFRIGGWQLVVPPRSNGRITTKSRFW